MASFGQNVRKRKLFERAFASTRTISRDIVHTTRSLYRRDHVNELVSTVEPQTSVNAVASKPWPASDGYDDGPSKAVNGDDGGDLTMQLKSFSPGATRFSNENEEYPNSINRTRPVTPENNEDHETPLPALHTLFPRPPTGASSLKRSNSEYQPRKAQSSSQSPEGMQQAFHVQFHRPSIPPRKESLPKQRVYLNLVDQSSRSRKRDSTQSVTAYVTAEYTSDAPATPTLTMTSWLSDPDGPPDDLASWNRPIVPQQPINSVATQPSSGAVGSAATRPQMAPRSKTTPVFSTAVPPVELPDAAYERVLREKLRHHAGQVKKRLDTSTYYSQTVRQNEIEIHLAFVRAAEEILKQSPFWRGPNDDMMQMKYLLERQDRMRITAA